MMNVNDAYLNYDYIAQDETQTVLKRIRRRVKERERERQTDRQTDRQTFRDRERGET